MKQWFAALTVVGLIWGCSGSQEGAGETDSGSQWSSSPAKVVEGLMHAYQTRNDSLYASLLAEEFRYYFEPPDSKPEDVLGWGKEEDMVATGNLFKTPDVLHLTLGLRPGEARESDRGQGWWVVPIDGGELRVEVKDKEPMEVTLNRQEIYLREGDHGWQVIEWRDYPDPNAEP